MVAVVHSDILDLILAPTYTDVFGKFLFLTTTSEINQSEHSGLIRRGALKRKELKRPVSDRG